MGQNFHNRKFEFLTKLVKNPQKNLEYSSRSANSKNIERLKSSIKTFEILGLEIIFLRDQKNCHNLIGDSEKIVGFIEEKRLARTSRGLNLQENVFR